jgi:hypothetical protein
MPVPRLVALAVFACSMTAMHVAADDKGPQSAEKEAAVDDATIISTAIQHFSEQKVALAFIGRESKKVILIHNESSGPSAYLSDSQLRAELRQEKWEIPSELSEGLRRRNAKAVSLSDLRFGKGVLVADLRKLPFELPGRDPPKEYEEAKAYADVWLPAYSSDGTTAVFRFSFGPTPHGATATYLLSKRDGIWRVSKWAFSYYA